MLDITHGGHFTFSDLCAFELASIVDDVRLDIPGADVSQVLNDGCGPMSPPASVAQPLINHFAVSFFNAKLKGSEASLAFMSQVKVDAIAGGAGVATVTTRQPTTAHSTRPGSNTAATTRRRSSFEEKRFTSV